MGRFDDMKRRRQEKAEIDEDVLSDRIVSLKTAVEQFCAFMDIPESDYGIATKGPLDIHAPAHKKLIERRFFVYESGDVECFLVVKIDEKNKDQISFKSLASDDPNMVTIADRYAVNVNNTDEERERSYDAASAVFN